MQDTQTIIILLTVIVSILSVMAIISLGFLIAILVKAKRVVKHIDETTTTIAKAVEWFSPGKLVNELIGLFNKTKS